MTYRQQQAANTERFNELTAEEKQELRVQGYRNVGKANVAKATQLLDAHEGFVVEATPVQEDEKDAIIKELQARIEELETELDEVRGELDEAEEEIQQIQEEQFFEGVPTLEEMSEEEQGKILGMSNQMEMAIHHLIHNVGNGYGTFTSRVINFLKIDRIDTALMMRGVLANGRYRLSGNAIIDSLA